MADPHNDDVDGPPLFEESSPSPSPPPPLAGAHHRQSTVFSRNRDGGSLEEVLAELRLLRQENAALRSTLSRPGGSMPHSDPASVTLKSASFGLIGSNVGSSLGSGALASALAAVDSLTGSGGNLEAHGVNSGGASRGPAGLPSAPLALAAAPSRRFIKGAAARRRWATAGKHVQVKDEAAAPFAARVQHWDPYPFILLNLALSFQAAYAAPFIMMSQNRQQEIDRREAEGDHQINIKAELEIELLHQKIDALREKEIIQLTQAVQTLTQMLDAERAARVAAGG